MADNKYGEIYTEDELVLVVQMAVQFMVEAVGNSDITDKIKTDERFSDANIREVARTDIERHFRPGEPLFLLLGRDKRALGALRFYRDHQWPSAPAEHLDSIDEAIARFEAYRNLAATGEPD